jgi:serine/threonine protein kinase
MMGTGRQPAGHMLHQRYRLLHAVGQGGMGAVYVAQDTQLGDRLVAVKEMSMSRLTPQEVPLAVEQFRREAHLLARLHHSNLPVIYEHFSENDRWYLVMSFIEGQNLQAALDATPGHKFPVKEVVRIGIELCDVLEYLHTHTPQIIFRDLKPLNIMLTPKGHICLIDFGIARHFKQEQTKDTAYYYSVGYAPPEQYGQSQTSPLSDIYSLGATLHQMLSGHNPANKPFQFANLQLVDPTIPVPLVKLVTQMLEMNEQARPASVAEIKAQLEKILNPTPLAETVLAKPEPAERRGESGGEKGTSQPESLLTGGQTAGFWGKINTFLSQRRRVAWICFIVLSLTIGSILPLLSWSIWNNSGPGFPLFVISNAEIFAPPYVTIVGAIGVAGFGLIFLLSKKRRPFLEMLGGTVLGGIAFTNLALSHYNYYHYYYYDDYYNYYHYYYYSDYHIIGEPIPYYFNIFIFLALFSLWLFVGTRFFLRSANITGSLLWGLLSIIGGISLLLPQGQFTLSLLTLLPALICEACGVIAIIVALRKRKQDKRTISSKEVIH